MNRLYFIFFFFTAILASDNPKLSLTVKNNIQEMQLAKGDSTIILPHRFVIDGSVKIKVLTGAFISFQVESIKGNLIFNESAPDTMLLLIEYDYLEGNLPLYIDSGIKTLPKIDDKIFIIPANN